MSWRTHASSSRVADQRAPAGISNVPAGASTDPKTSSLPQRHAPDSRRPSLPELRRSKGKWDIAINLQGSYCKDVQSSAYRDVTALAAAGRDRLLSRSRL